MAATSHSRNGSSAGLHQQQPQVQPCRYKTGKTLGAGSYSVVKECVHIETGRYYAAKVINKRLMAGREHMVRNEIAVLKRVSMGHQNILTLVDYFETMNNLYLVTDLALGGELFDRICRKGNYYESDAAELIRATLSAVAYLHDHGIVHRDLKPENLLFRTPEENADLLIADFGLSRIMDEEQFHVLTTTCGTPGYMAPEIFRKSGHGKPVDLWAIGVITYFLLCGYTPFDRDSNLEEMQAILDADYSFLPIEYWSHVSMAARQFIKRCLTVDSVTRITAHEALSHPWITGEGEGDAATGTGRGNADLLPTVRKNFNARRTLHAAIDTIRAIQHLRAGGAAAMGVAANAAGKAAGAPSGNTNNNASSKSGAVGDAFANIAKAALAGSKNAEAAKQGSSGAAADGAATAAAAPGAGSGSEAAEGQHHDHDHSHDHDDKALEAMEGVIQQRMPEHEHVDHGVGKLGIDPRGNARGQTQAQIEEQQRRIEETTRGLWEARKR